MCTERPKWRHSTTTSERRERAMFSAGEKSDVQQTALKAGNTAKAVRVHKGYGKQND